jgi:hypothetical protein
MSRPMATAKKKTSRKTSKKPGKKAASSGGRGSPEAIEKRRVARALNDLFKGRKQGAVAGLDGRTEKRRQRLVKELKTGLGRKGERLSPVDRLQHMHQLLEIGETTASLRQQGVKFPRKVVPELRGQDALVAQVQSAYDFSGDAWSILGVKDL